MSVSSLSRTSASIHTRAKCPREPHAEHTSETGQLRASWSPSTSPHVKHLRGVNVSSRASIYYLGVQKAY